MLSNLDVCTLVEKCIVVPNSPWARVESTDQPRYSETKPLSSSGTNDYFFRNLDEFRDFLYKPRQWAEMMKGFGSAVQ